MGNLKNKEQEKTTSQKILEKLPLGGGLFVFEGFEGMGLLWTAFAALLLIFIVIYGVVGPVVAGWIVSWNLNEGSNVLIKAWYALGASLSQLLFNGAYLSWKVLCADEGQRSMIYSSL